MTERSTKKLLLEALKETGDKPEEAVCILGERPTVKEVRSLRCRNAQLLIYLKVS